jgi:hypothetical protein
MGWWVLGRLPTPRSWPRFRRLTNRWEGMAGTAELRKCVGRVVHANSNPTGCISETRHPSCTTLTFLWRDDRVITAGSGILVACIIETGVLGALRISFISISIDSIIPMLTPQMAQATKAGSVTQPSRHGSRTSGVLGRCARAKAKVLRDIETYSGWTLAWCADGIFFNKAAAVGVFQVVQSIPTYDCLVISST